MAYVDGYIIPVPTKNMKAYAKMAKLGGKIWMQHGAVSYVECVAEDMQKKFGLPFPKMVKPKKGETIVFSFITFKSRKHRDQVNAKVMSDERMSPEHMPAQMPFDFKRMAYGGFTSLVDL